MRYHTFEEGASNALEHSGSNLIMDNQCSFGLPYSDMQFLVLFDEYLRRNPSLVKDGVVSREVLDTYVNFNLAPALDEEVPYSLGLLHVYVASTEGQAEFKYFGSSAEVMGVASWTNDTFFIEKYYAYVVISNDLQVIKKKKLK